MKKRLLVFPCGSEVALEIYRSLRFSRHFDVIGASSVNDHGKFVFARYIGGVPLYDDPNFIPIIKKIVEKERIDGIFPAMDAVARMLKSNEDELGCIVIGSDAATTAICASKGATYRSLEDKVPCPQWTYDIEKIDTYPVFIKPDEGYGSRNVHYAHTQRSAQHFVSHNPHIPFVFCEYLQGEEYTIDCFSSRNGELLFYGARCRARVSNGISVSTAETKKHAKAFMEVSAAINETLRPRGAWFFQMKENAGEQPVLLEVASRLGGSSCYFRAKGVNFALLSAFDAFGFAVSVDANKYSVELDRALSSRYRIDLEYDTVYIDFDDCLLMGDQINTVLISFIFEARNSGVKVVLITRHEKDINQSLKKFRVADIFDEIIHIQDKRPKSDFIANKRSIFIDDSFSERDEVRQKHGIPVFSPDMIEMLIG